MTYKGIRILGKPIVYVNDKELHPGPSLQIVNHSPDGFEWGYGGSGSAQLALAILLDYLKDPRRAMQFHQDFKWAFLALANPHSFEISEKQIEDFLGAMEAKMAKPRMEKSNGKF